MDLSLQHINPKDIDSSRKGSYDTLAETEISDPFLRSPKSRSFQGGSFSGPRTSKETFLTQAKALFSKNWALQAKQKGTNFCQILIPISCLVILLLFKTLAQSEFTKVYSFNLEMPYFFNIPYWKAYNQSFNLGNQSTHLLLSNCLEWYLYDFKNASQETRDYISPNKQTSGLLDHILPQVDGVNDLYKCPKYGKSMPYFERLSNGTINQQIFNNLQYLNNQPFDNNVDAAQLDIIPDGAITFYKADDKELSFKIQTNDIRLMEYHRGNGVTKIYLYDPKTDSKKTTLRVADGQLIMLDLLSKAYLYKHNPKVVLLSASQYMPFTTSEESFIIKAMNILGATLYPVALSVIFPVFLYTLVLEKEERLREMMKMNGMKTTYYWIVNYFWNTLLYLVSSLLFLIFGMYVLKLPFFVETNLVVLLTMIFGWGLCQVSMSFFFQNFLTRVRTATIVGYLLSIWTSIIAIGFSMGIYPYPNYMPMSMKIYPPFAFCRLIYRLSVSCGNFVCARGFFDFDEEMRDCLYILYISAAVFLVLGIYIDQVMPQEFGVTKHPFFFLKSCFGKKKPKENPYSQFEDQIPEGKNFSSAININEEDEDVKAENKFVSQLIPPYDDYPLVVKNLRKVYKPVGGRPSKVAVKNFSLHIKKGEMFGLLGPNGAGKTSLISMLTGLYQPEAGNAWVGGCNILDQIDEVHSRMGVCPQFDLLWPELTVEEHLQFYARMRGVPKDIEASVVEKAISDVRLTKFAKFATKQLSGGMKRRLSVAIAFVGNPQIILLDEPTTGLDPENRRSLWDILVEARKDRAMMLTTHSMEEADVLCTRIGILVSGSMKCIGPQTRLKTKYGGGYQLVIHCHKDKYLMSNSNPSVKTNSANYYHTKVQEYIAKVFPNAILKTAFNGSFLYQIPIEGLEVSKVFEEIDSKKEELAISDWGISQSTLEDVFMEIVKYVEEKNEEN